MRQEKFVLSDFNLYLREDKGFTEDDIENLLQKEMEKYLKEYIELEKQS